MNSERWVLQKCIHTPMEIWNERIRTSTAAAQVTELKRLIEGIDSSKISSDAQDYIDRVELVVDTVSNSLSTYDPRLVNIPALNSIGSTLTNIVSYFNSWINGPDDTYLNNHIQSELDAVVSQLVILAPGQDLPAAREAVSSLRRSVGRHRAIVDEAISDVTQKGTDANATIEQKVEEAKREFSVLEQNVNDLDENLKSIKTASTQVTTEQQTAFTKAEADRSTTFNKLVSEKQKELETSLADYGAQVKSAVEGIRTSVKSDEDEILAAKVRVEEILGIVGEEALVGDYAKNAKDEQAAADLWRWITAGSIIIAVGVAGWLAWHVTNSTSWQHVLTKTVVVISFGGLASYAARQSSEHRQAQRDAERMALQLKALKPYLSDIDETGKRDELLSKIADRLFGQSTPLIKLGKNSKTKNDNPMLTAQLIEAVLELLKKAK